MDKQILLKYDKNGVGFFHIIFEYDVNLVKFIKKIPTRKFHAPTSTWKIRADHVTAKYVEAFARKLDFEVDPSAKDYIDRMVHPVFAIEIPKLKRDLRQFQKEGVIYAVKYERCFISDEMGLGKSGEAIAAVEATNSYPCLIICPASLKLNWKKEIALWLDKSVKVVDGLIKINYETIHDKKVVSGYEMPDYDADFVIINYDILYREKKGTNAFKPDNINIPEHKDLLKKIGFKSIIVDECHAISNHKSLRTKAVKEISRKIRYRYALSGTPILNRPKELIAQLDFLDRLETLGGFWTFAKRYCAAYEGTFGWDFSGSSNLDELHENMKKTCFIRRKKEDVLDELPPKQRIMLPVELSNAKEYETASKNFRKWMKMNQMDESEYYEELKNITQLTDSQRKMIATAKATQKLNKTLAAEALVKIEKLKQIVAKGKLNKVYEFIDNFLLYDEKLLIFAKHQEIYKKLIEKYKDISVHIVGGMTSKQKDKAVEEFQNNPNIKLFIGALDAAGVGLNLTQSSTVAFVELGWTSAIHDQAEDRCILNGQLVLTKNGYKKIDDVNIGDYVYTHKGNWNKITNKSSKLERNKYCVDITYKGFNTSQKTTNDHLIYVYNKLNEEYEWTNAEDINILNNYIAFPFDNKKYNELKYIKFDKKVKEFFINNYGISQKNGRLKNINNKIKITDDLLFAFGWYVAEGWSVISDKKSCMVGICGNLQKEVDIVNCVSNSICKSFNIDKYSHYKSKKNTYSAMIYSKELSILFKEWFGSNSYNKMFPEWVFTLSDRQLQIILNGYFSGDGYNRKNTQQASTSSNILAAQLCILSAKLNNPITLRKLNNEFGWSFEYSIIDKIKRNTLIKIDKKNGYILFPIEKIEKYKFKRGNERVYDLSVKNDNSFIIGLSSVHNCHRIGQKDFVKCYYFYSEKTIDEQILELIKKKRAITANISDGITIPQDSAVDDDITEILSKFI